MVLCLAVVGCWRGGEIGSAGPKGETDGDTDSDADGDTDADTGPETDSWDEEDGGVAFPMSQCAAGAGLFDHVTDLCWQDQPDEEWFSWGEAKSYCEGLVLNGFFDWRVPTIMELITLIRGCVTGEATSDLGRSECPISSSLVDCPYDNCLLDEECLTCPSFEGPGEGGCYRDPSLDGVCGNTWSASPSQLLPGYKWTMDFESARADRVFSSSYHLTRVRCVHDTP